MLASRHLFWIGFYSLLSPLLFRVWIRLCLYLLRGTFSSRLMLYKYSSFQFITVTSSPIRNVFRLMRSSKFTYFSVFGLLSLFPPSFYSLSWQFSFNALRRSFLDYGVKLAKCYGGLKGEGRKLLSYLNSLILNFMLQAPLFNSSSSSVPFAICWIRYSFFRVCSQQLFMNQKNQSFSDPPYNYLLPFSFLFGPVRLAGSG